MSPRGRRILLGVVAVCALLAAFGGTASAKDKITICHRGGGPTYIVITVAPVAAIAGHAAIHPLDIIPAFTYRKNGATVRFRGQNLNEEGIAIIGNQCVAPRVPLGPTGDDTPGDGNTPGGGSEDGGAGNDDADAPGITLCHWQAPGEYQEEELPPLAALAEHSTHPRDVIPAFAYEGPSGAGFFDGENLTAEGIALLTNDCIDPEIEKTAAPGQSLIDLAKSAVDVNGGTLEPGDRLTFTIVATNVGTSTATDVVITDAIPAATAYVPDSATVAPGTAEVLDGYLIARIGEGASAEKGGTLKGGATATVSFTVRVREGLPVGATILNAAHATTADGGNDEPTESDSNPVEFPIDAPPMVPADIDVDPPTTTPYPGTDLTTVVEFTPTTDLGRVAVCTQVQVPPRPGANTLGTVRSSCRVDRTSKRGSVNRTIFNVRIPRAAAGRCIRLSTSLRTDGYSLRERSTRLCVRRLSAVYVEPVTG